MEVMPCPSLRLAVLRASKQAAVKLHCLISSSIAVLITTLHFLTLLFTFHFFCLHHVIVPGVCEISPSCLGLVSFLLPPVLSVHGFYPPPVFTHVSPLLFILKYP